MARTTLTRTTPLGPYPTLPPAANSLDAVMTAADTVNFNQFTFDGPGLLMVQNIGAGAHTFTLTSAVDAQNRSGDITAYSIAADEVCVFAFTQTTGWRQTDGFLYLAGDHAEVKFGFIRL